MKPKTFKVGDRIVVYDYQRLTGTVNYINFDGTIQVLKDCDRSCKTYHYKQCRKLKEKSKLVLYVAMSKDENLVYYTNTIYENVQEHIRYNQLRSAKIVKFFQGK